MALLLLCLPEGKQECHKESLCWNKESKCQLSLPSKNVCAGIGDALWTLGS